MRRTLVLGLLASFAVTGIASSSPGRSDPPVLVPWHRVWFGDGASSRADTHEAMNLAGVLRLPVVFVCDNNQWAYSTPTHLQYAVERIADRAPAYGFEGVTVDGTDVLAVYRQARRAVDRAREGGGPALVECVTLRMEGHAAHDDAFYVPREMFEAWAKHDPIERFRAWLRENVAYTDSEDEQLHKEVESLLEDALRRAESSSPPDGSTVIDGVYAELLGDGTQ